MNFNLNSKVTFTLSKHGEQVFWAMPMAAHDHVQRDDHGRMNLRLWQFMSLFGPYMPSGGGVSLFEHNGVHIEPAVVEDQVWVRGSMYMPVVKLGHLVTPKVPMVMEAPEEPEQVDYMLRYVEKAIAWGESHLDCTTRENLQWLRDKRDALKEGKV